MAPRGDFQGSGAVTARPRAEEEDADAGARALLFMMRENGTLRRVTLAEDGGAGTSDIRY